ncbi:hypothetical protein ACIHFD_55210 [Nonomuraea sp. NPDC051941]|uniref:hypothetical protein n=1 Tax=Nonomuraea sp. NPDC051941 TaxID=3364373 RepID=UPI0037C71B5E
MSTTILNLIGGIAAALAAAACLPRAATHLIKACVPLVAALTELRAAIIHATRQDASTASNSRADLLAGGKPQGPKV